jgi:CRP/FNR family transcriptional regulator, anaerobic regulatory protein
MQPIRQLIKDLAKGITTDELDFVMTHFRIKSVEKGDYLLHENRICRDLSIVKSGCFKVTHHSDTIIWFAFENMPITEMQSFITQSPTAFSIQAIENSEVFTIDYETLQQLYNKFDSFKMFGLRFTERILAKTISRATSLQFDSPEIRYLKLFQDLASYLGVTPNSLSRIRSRISKER